MPSVTRPARDDSHRVLVEQQVLAAVERLLTDGESFTALGIQRIAAAAGMARTTFYGHFRDKPSLLIRLTESATTRLFAAAEEWVRDARTGREDLERTVAELIAEYRKHRPLLRAVNELASYEPAVEEYWRTAIDRCAELVAERIARDQAARLIPASVNPLTTATWIVWGTERTIAMHVMTHAVDTATDAELAAGIATATWAAMQRA